jgi:hypothetical protein
VIGSDYARRARSISEKERRKNADVIDAKSLAEAVAD